MQRVLGEGGGDGRAEYEVLEGEEKQHGGPALERGDDGVVEEGAVEGEEQRDERRDAHVRERGDGGRLLHVGDAVVHQPVEDLKEEERREEADEAQVELLAEDRHREARLGDGVPRALVQRLHLRVAQPAEEDALEERTEEDGEDERLVRQHQQVELRRREVDHLRCGMRAARMSRAVARCARRARCARCVEAGVQATQAQASATRARRRLTVG